MLIGYARVSTAHNQDTAAQLRAFKEVGVESVFGEHASGGRWDRPALRIRKSKCYACICFRSAWCT